MSATKPPHVLSETVAPYLTGEAHISYTKLSISLPSDLVELVRGAAESSGSSVSAMIAAALRKTIDDQDQARLDEAIEAQNEENLEWAAAFDPVSRGLLAKLEW